MANDVLIEMLASLSLDSGIVTSLAEPGTTILSDSSKNWPAGKLKHCIVRIVSGNGTGQLARITGNNAHSLLVSPSWIVGLDTSSVYVIYRPEVSDQVDRILANVNTLLARLTAARSTLLDRLTEITAARMEELDPAGLPAAIQGLVDITVPAIDEGAGSLNYDEADAGEQTLLILPVAERARIGSIWLDAVNITRITVVRLYHQIDGAGYRQFAQYSFDPATDSDGIMIDGFTVYRNAQISLQCDGLGAGLVAVPYAIV